MIYIRLLKSLLLLNKVLRRLNELRRPYTRPYKPVWILVSFRVRLLLSSNH